MLPSSGYFQSVACPFYNNGLCERPHCHFRHVKREALGKSSYTILTDESLITNTEDGKKSDLLKMVDMAIKKVQEDVERNTAVLEAVSYSTNLESTNQYENDTPITYIPTPVVKSSVLPLPVPSVSHKEIKTSKSSVPQYRPTPISELKKLQKLSEKEYDPVNNFSTPAQPVKRKKYPEYIIPEEKYVEKNEETDDDYVPKRPKVCNDTGTILNKNDKNNCEFSDTDDDWDVAPEFSDNESDEENAINSKATNISNKSSEISQNKPISIDTCNDSQTVSESSSVINEFNLVDKILLECKKTEEIISGTTNKIEKTPSAVNKYSNEKTEKLITSDKKDSINIDSKIKKTNKFNNNKKIKTDDNKPSKLIGKSTKETSHSANKNNIETPKLANTHNSESSKSSNKNNSESSKSSNKSNIETHKSINKNTIDVLKKDLSKQSLRSHKKISNSKDTKIKDSKIKKSCLDIKKHKSDKTKPGIHIKGEDEIKTSKSNKSNSETLKKNLSTKVSKISSDHSNSKSQTEILKKKESCSSNIKTVTSKKSEMVSNDKIENKHRQSKNEKKYTDELKSQKSTLNKTIKFNNKVEKSEMLSPTLEKKTVSKIDSEPIVIKSDSDIELPDIDLDSDLDDHDTYEECWKIFHEATIKKETDDSNLNKIRQLQESKTKESEIVVLGKKRVAHQPTLTRSVTSGFSSRISPGQIMHNRYLKLQEMYKNTAKIEEKKTPSAFLSRLNQSDSGKKRIAHVPNATLLAAAAEKQKLLNQAIVTSKSSTIATTISKGEKRIAHIPTTLKDNRPIIPAEYGSKVPSNVRQRYLDKFIEECLKFCESEEIAYQTALEEEQSAYHRSSTKTVYLNVAVNTLKKLRNKMSVIIHSDDSNNSDDKKQKPNTCTSNKVISHEFILGGSKAAKTSFSIERRKTNKFENDDIKGAKLYKLLKPYIMTEQQLEENRFPRPHPSDPGKAVILNSQKKSISNNPLERTCCRCQTKYRVTTKGKYVKEEECVHHWGRLWKRRIAGAVDSRYSCCQGDAQSEGCCVAQGHVFEDSETDNLKGYVKTLIKSPSIDGNYGVYALDCEMCYSTAGVELTRITVIGSNLKPVYETLVKPENPVLDYNTRFSGITEEDLFGVCTSIGDVQAVLLSLFNSQTILIGHSLDSDFKALKLIHNTVVDTSVVFPHKMGPPYKRALRTLMAEYLNKIIQNSVDGHDSQEDALACMELMMWKIKEDVRKSLR